MSLSSKPSISVLSSNSFRKKRNYHLTIMQSNVYKIRIGLLYVLGFIHQFI